jgi:hypothetical protein
MIRVFKYQLAIADRQVLSMPKGAKILCVQIQRASPQIWALVDDAVTITDQRIIHTYEGAP